MAFATGIFLRCFGDNKIWWINRWKMKPSKTIKMLTYLAQHREVLMQSQDRVQLLIFIREDRRDVWVLWAKINFTSGQCMLWRSEPRIKAHWFCCNWRRIHYTLPEGQHPSKLEDFQISGKHSTSLRARAAFSFPKAWCSRQLLTLLLIRPVVCYKWEKEGDGYPEKFIRSDVFIRNCN